MIFDNDPFAEEVGTEEQEEQTEQEAFEVSDLETAAEAQRRIAHFMEKQQKIDQIAENQIAPFLEKIEKIKMWQEQEKEKYMKKQAFYENRLERYMRQEVEEQKKKGRKPQKTIKLPYGTLKLIKQQPEFQRNDSELLGYAKENGFLKVAESVDWSSIKSKCTVFGDKLIDPEGQLVPGVT
ncbi:host-nuclease inhibitor Gam family protein, partial [Streptomyces sp. NPDC059989]|uniref:host-nuclease inhibitor Gam family protein n=1 Tax=Streptomyces sp. NPDC059989 TaxID=3347026 RepID=UPI0036924AC6